MPVALPSGPIPKAIANLGEDSTRAEFTPVAIEAFAKLVEIWRLTAGQAAALLGEGSSRTWFRIKSGERTGTLSQDALTRVSALTGVYKGLHLLFSEPLGRRLGPAREHRKPFRGALAYPLHDRRRNSSDARHARLHRWPERRAFE